MKKLKFIKAAFCSLILSAGVLPVTALDAYVTVIYRDVDIAFVNKSEKELNGVLSKNNEDRNYYLVENYTMKKIRHLIVDEDFNFASKATLVVIDNNLDNMEAVDLYATISAALQRQEEQKRLVEEKKKAEIAKFEAEKAKQKAKVEKEYIAVQAASGEAVYLKEKYEKLTSVYWNARFGMFVGTLVNDTENSYNSFRYGISGDGTYEYSFDNLMIGFDAGADASIIPLSGDDGTILGNFELIPKIGFNNFSKKFSFRGGFATVIRIDSGEKNTSTLTKTVYSPAFGIGLNHIHLGSATLSMSADYLLGTLAYNGINAGVNSKINLAIPVTTMDKVRLTFNMGVKDTLFVKESGIENRAGMILAIGAENVIK